MYGKVYGTFLSFFLSVPAIGKAPLCCGFYIHSATKNQPDSCSVADPGCFIPDPDPTIAPSWIRGVKKHRIPDPTYFFHKVI
jgi:hypothetical protein